MQYACSFTGIKGRWSYYWLRFSLNSQIMVSGVIFFFTFVFEIFHKFLNCTCPFSGVTKSKTSSSSFETLKFTSVIRLLSHHYHHNFSIPLSRCPNLPFVDQSCTEVFHPLEEIAHRYCLWILICSLRGLMHRDSWQKNLLWNICPTLIFLSYILNSPSHDCFVNASLHQIISFVNSGVKV